MFEGEGVEEGFGGLLVLAAELTHGFELALQVLVGAAGDGVDSGSPTEISVFKLSEALAAVPRPIKSAGSACGWW